MTPLHIGLEGSWASPAERTINHRRPLNLIQVMLAKGCLLSVRLPWEFSSGYFDIVIADECHRSIYRAWQAALTHFNAFHIGLTATPLRPR